MVTEIKKERRPTTLIRINTDLHKELKEQSESQDMPMSRYLKRLLRQAKEVNIK